MLRISLLVGVALAASVTAADAQVQSGIPDFTSIDRGWLLNGGIDFHPVEGKVPPISFDPAYPQIGTGNQRGVMERMSDAENANLTPWAKTIMRKFNQDVLNGHRAFSAQSRCWPGGVPGQMLVPAEPIFFIQTPQEVWIVWQRDHMVRRIYLNREHGKDIKPSWFGESVGHYENDELVVDTIGLAEGEYSFVDNWRTPHTKDLHVVERWKLIDGGNKLQVTVTVDDPGAFVQPWSGTAEWRKVNQGPMLESVCAENNGAFEQFFKLQEYPQPEAKTPDF
jgi:hypothetical protein